VLWDILKTIVTPDAEEYQGKEGIRRVSNLGKFYLHLLSTQSAPITILKSLSFTSLSPLQTLFCQLVIGGVLSFNATEDSKAEKRIKDIFSKSREATEEFREGLAFFISQYMSPKSDDVVVGVPESLDRAVLKTRVKFTKTVLAGRNI
jgi:hypothetical protein